MPDPFRKAVSMLDPVPVEEGPSKVMPLSEAMRTLVKPGMAIHLCTTHNRAGGVLFELVRAFFGKDPGFTLSCIGFVANGVVPVHTGIARKLITTFCGDSYPTPGPNPVITRAWKQGRVEIENWSILSFTLRLLAGAMGAPFLPTRSLVGSSMATDNRELLIEAEEDGHKYTLVKPLCPDLSFIHAPCADRSGNVILTPPHGEDAYGAWASKGGVVVSVDKVVSTEFIRRHSHIAKIPSYMVRAVCPIELGAHPGGVSSQGCPEFESYADDYEFIMDIREAAKEPETMDRWVEEWILEPDGWEGYLEKLGRDRIWALKGKAKPDSWKSELISLSSQIPADADYSPVEMMVVAAGRVIAERMKEGDLTTILAGVGASNLAAWLGYYQLLQEGVQAELMAEIGFFGYAPRPADPFIFNYRNMPTAKMLTGIHSIMGVFMGGAGNCCIGSVGAGQLDRHGNLNTTMIPGKAYLTGSGGGNDICSAASEVVVTALSGRQRFVDKVAYVTSPGSRVKTVVSDLAVLRKPEGEKELVLCSYFPGAGKGEKQAIEEIKDKCGWELKEAPDMKAEERPSMEEIKLLRILDPQRRFLGKR